MAGSALPPVGTRLYSAPFSDDPTPVVSGFGPHAKVVVRQTDPGTSRPWTLHHYLELNTTITEYPVDQWTYYNDRLLNRDKKEYVGWLYSTTYAKTIVAATSSDIVSGAINVIGQSVSAFASDASGFIDKLVAGVESFIEGIIGRIGDFIAGIVGTVGAALSDFARSAQAWVQGLIDSATEWVEQVSAAIAEGLSDALDGVQEWVTERWNDANSIIDRLASAAEEIADFFQFEGKEYLENATASVTAWIDTVVPSMDAIANYFRTIIDDPQSFWLNSIAPGLSAGLPFILDTLFGYLGAREETNQGYVLNLIDRIGSVLGGYSNTDFEALMAAFEVEGTTPLFRSVVNIAILFAVIPSLLAAARVPTQAKIAEWASEQLPWNRLTLAEYLAARRRGIIDDTDYTAIASRLGYDGLEQIIYDGVTQTLPTDGELLTGWLRDELGEKDLDRMLLAQGYGAERRALMKRLVFFIPPPADLILMAVREAFSPDVVSRYGMDEDFPEEFARWAKKQGIDDQWAHMYWRAHWRLPSAEQGYEMLHRGIIDQGELAVLLRSLDYMPTWRERLTRLSYSPLTRVDVRRMHAMGALDRKGVVKAYHDIGYDDDNADLLADFTELLTDNSQFADDPELRGITRANVLKFFRLGLFNYSESISALLDMGYSAWGADLLLDSELLARDADEREELAQLTLEQLRARQLNLSDAIGQLSRLGFEASENARFIAKAQRIDAERTETPPVPDLIRMVRAGAITLDQLRSALAARGYPENWVDAYVTLVAKGSNDAIE